MSKVKALNQLITSSELHNLFVELYGTEEAEIQKQIGRYRNLVAQYQRYFQDDEIELFSTPGRTELSGNHTDHNAGRVIAAAIDLDSIAAVSKTADNQITIFSEGFPEPFRVDLRESLIPQKKYEGTTTGLICGIVFRMNELGFRTGGFNACITSQVKVGSGLSSSASIEILIGTILNSLFNHHQIEPETLAQIGQYAENVHFNKPCGLMDQTACAIGGVITIDFRNPRAPMIQKIQFDFNAQNYHLLIVDTGGSHADLVSDYAAIPSEMKSVASALGGKVCRDIDLEQLLHHVKELRPQVGDRALLRSFHFLSENQRVMDQIHALETGDFDQFLHLVSESGNSSFKWLQNSYTTKDVSEQGISLGLALTEYYLKKIGKGACRVHGGGFSGTIQTYLPKKYLGGYIELMEQVFGQPSVLKLNIRSHGSIHLNSIL